MSNSKVNTIKFELKNSVLSGGATAQDRFIFTMRASSIGVAGLTPYETKAFTVNTKSDEKDDDLSSVLEDG